MTRLLTGVILIMLAIAAAPLQAQSPDLAKVRLDELYSGNLPAVLNEITTKTGYRFKIDREEYKSVFIVMRPNHLKSFLEGVCREHRMKYYFAADSTIVLLDRNAPVEGVDALTQRSYQGPPVEKRFTLTGTIRDAMSGETLPFVSIGIPGTNIGVVSNVDGQFTLLNVPTDTTMLTVSYLGYQTLNVYLTPKTPKTGLTIEMVQSGSMLAEVTIASDREELMHTNTNTVSMIKMAPSKIATLPSVGERDIMRAFQLMPGVSAANENSSGLYVRGGTPDQNLNVFDGFTVYHVDHLFGFFSAFNPNAVKDVQLYKGGFPAKFGGRISSVAELTGKEGNQFRTSGGVDIGLLSINAYLEQPFGDKLTIFLAARRSWKSPLYRQLFNRFAGESDAQQPPGGGPRGNLASFSSTVQSYFYDLNGKMTFKPNSKDIYTLSFFNGTDDMDNSNKISLPNFPGSSGTNRNLGFGINDLTRWGNTGGSFKWSRRWNKKLYSNTLIGASNYFSKRDRTSGGSFTDPEGNERTVRNGTIENNDLVDVTAKTDWELKLSDNNRLEFGAQYTNLRIKYNFAQNDTVTILNRDETGNTGSLYFQDKIELFNDRVILQPGLRATYFDVTSQTYLEPRASATWQITPRLKAKAAFGEYYQFANRIVREDVLQGSRDFWILSDNDRIPVSKAWHFIGGMAYETNNWLFDVEGYHKILSGLTEYSLRYNVRPGRGVTYDENFYNGKGYAQGIEFLAQKKYGKYNGWASYTLGRVKYQFDQYGLSYFSAAQDVTHEFKMVHLYQWRKFDFSASWIYATGKPYTAPEGAYQLTLLDGTEQGYLNVGAKNGFRLPDYHRLDIAATYRFNRRKDGRELGSLGLSIFNLYNRANVWYKEYEIVDSQLIENNVRFLGITPNLNFSYKF